MRIDDAAFQSRALLSVGDDFRAALVIEGNAVIRLVDGVME